MSVEPIWPIWVVISVLFVCGRLAFGSEIDRSKPLMGLTWFRSYIVFAHLWCGWLACEGWHAESDSHEQWAAWGTLAAITTFEAWAFFTFHPQFPDIKE